MERREKWKVELLAMITSPHRIASECWNTYRNINFEGDSLNTHYTLRVVIRLIAALDALRVGKIP